MNPSLHYPWRALLPDYAGGAIGLAFSSGLLAFVQPTRSVAWVLAAVAALFLVYLGRTVCRQMTRFELDEAGIRARGLLGAAIRWEDLCSLRLDYYSTRRDPEGRTMQGGWMQLKLRGSRHTWRTWRTSATLRIDSELEGFADLVRAVAFEARRRGVNFDWATRANLHVLGIDPALAEAA